MKVARVTISDRAFRGVYPDLGGPEVERVFLEKWADPVEFVAEVVPDEHHEIVRSISEFVDIAGCALVVTTGGTGPAPRDITPEATREVIEKELPGFGEIQRMASFEKVPTAILSRAVAGIRGSALIINLPGNPKAIGECLPLLMPAIREALKHLGQIAER